MAANRIFFGLLLAAMSTGAMAEWVKVVDVYGTGMYIDPATIRKNGNFRKVWELTEYQTPILEDVKSSKQFVEYDCSGWRSRKLFSSIHTGSMGGGRMLESSSDTGDWKYKIPDSPGGKLFNAVCGK